MKNTLKKIQHNQIDYIYEIDKNGIIWIVRNNTKINIGQIRALNKKDNVEKIIIQMIEKGNL
jgi:hypothetical protein